MPRSDPPVPDPSEGAFAAVAPYYDHLMAGVPYPFWVQYLERLWKHHSADVHTVLDLACGTGAVARLLAQRGYHITGVDLAEAMLAAARSKTRAEGLTIPFYQQDAADLNLPGQAFDSVVCLFDSLNYILEDTRLRQCFGRVWEHLTPGGVFVFDVNTEYALSEGMFNQSCTRRDEPLHYRWRSRYDPLSQICTVRMNFTFTPDKAPPQMFTEVHRQRAYLKDDLAAWLAAAGFEEIAIYDAYSLERAKKRSDRLFFVARRPA